MANIPNVVITRLRSEVPKFQKILQSARDRDINEADTVVIITDMLESIFGLDKYEDVTREFAIKGTYVDLAVRTGNRVDYLIEVKAIGIDLKETHLRQAIDYAAKEGVRWVVLTNGIDWQVHRVIVDGQVSNEKVAFFNFLELSMRKQEDTEMVFMLCKRAINKDLIEEFYEHRQACNKFVIGALLGSEEVAGTVRRILRKITPGLRVTVEEIQTIINSDVIKREVSESEAGADARKRLKRTLAKLDRQKGNKKESKKSSGDENQYQEPHKESQ